MIHSPARAALLALSTLTSMIGVGCADPLETAPDRGASVDDTPAAADPSTELSSSASANADSVLAQTASADCAVAAIPADLRASWKLDPWYQRYASVDGVLILSSGKPADDALHKACLVVKALTSKHPESRAALVKAKAKFAMIGFNEKTTDPPEYRSLPDWYNTRARGLGGQLGLCAEESIMCDRRDRWFGENITVHEYAHTISIYGFTAAIPTFKSRLTAAFRNSRSKGLWNNTYGAENEQEYWAEGVQSYYYTNLESARPNGVHGPIDTREELKTYDPTLYELIEDTVPSEMDFPDCYRKKK